MKIKESCKRIYTNTTQRKSRNARKFCLIDKDDLEDDTFDESECSEEEYIEVERRNNCSLNDIKIIQKTKEKVKTKRKPKIISKDKPVKMCSSHHLHPDLLRLSREVRGMSRRLRVTGSSGN